jgi:cytochrome c biogenesis protein
MRTALLLLFLLALGSVPGGFLPQRALAPAKVQSFYAAHPHLAPLLDKLSMFAVFSSPWFAAVYLLLFVSLVGCLVPRTRLHARALRTPPPAVPATLSRLPVSDRWHTALAPDEVVAAARAALPRWRRVVRGGSVSAEKGYLRETGNLLFHVSLVALLVGIALGGLFGFKGTVLVKEGDGFADAVLNFDDINPGRRFDPASLAPFHLVLDDFRATYTARGAARTFDATLRWAPTPDAPERPYRLEVNSPLNTGHGAKVYLVGHGYAPRVVVTGADGQVGLEQAVPCLPQNATFVSNCVIKVPDAGPVPLAFEGVFTPTTVQDPKTGRVGSVSPAADVPALTLVAYRGDLGLDSGIPASVYSLDKARLKQVDAPPHALRPGQTWALPGGGSIRFVGTSEWVTLQVTQDPGKVLALYAAAGMVVGLLLSLRVRRRRVWVRAVPDPAGGRTVVEVGGLSRTDAEAFAGEFAAVTTRLRERTDPLPDPPEPDLPEKDVTS